MIPRGMLIKIKSYILSLLVCLFFANVNAETTQQHFNDLESALIREGFENVAVIQDSNELYIYFQNEIYRDDLAAIIRVISVLQTICNNNLQNVLTITLLPLHKQCASYGLQLKYQNYTDFLKMHTDTDLFFEKIKVKEKVNRTFKITFLNSSLWKFDLSIVPQIAANLGNYDDRFKVNLNLLPTLDFSPWRGAQLVMQYNLPLADEFVWQESRSTFNLFLFNQLYNLPGGIKSYSEVGLLGKERWGITFQIGRYFLNRKIAVGAKYDKTGALYNRDSNWYYSQMKADTYQIYFDYNYIKYNLLFGISYNKFLLQDYGWRFDISRFFREIQITSFFGLTNLDKFFGLSIRLPLNRYKSAPRNRLNARITDYYTWSYKASSDVYTYSAPRQTGITLGENRSLRNFFYYTLPGYLKNNSMHIFTNIQDE